MIELLADFDVALVALSHFGFLTRGF